MAHCHSNQLDGPSGGLTTSHQLLIPGGSALSEPSSTTACLHQNTTHPLHCTACANVPLPYSTANHVPIYLVPTLCCTACLYAPLFSPQQYCTAPTVSFCTTSTPRARSHHSVDCTLLAIGTLLAHYLHIACTLPAVGTPLAHCLHIDCTLLTHFLLLTHRLHTTHTWYKVRHI